jgi:hypothetical protein
MPDLTCRDCPEDGPSVNDQWETFEDIPLCDACLDQRYEVRVSMGIRMPVDWEIDLDR